MISEIFAAAVAGAASVPEPKAHVADVLWVAPHFEVSAAQVGDFSGGEFGIGGRIGLGPIRLTPMAGAFVYGGEAEANTRFRSETFSNGNSVCRDTTNGQFANAENCKSNLNIDFAAYGKLEIAVSLPWGEVGAGQRFSDMGNSGFGRIGLFLGEPNELQRGFVNLKFGSDYVGLGIALTR